jgi:hypothetical protein
MNRALPFILIALGLLGAYKIISQKLAERKERSNPFMADIRDLLEEHRKAEVSATDAAPWYSSEATFFEVMSLMHRATKMKYSPTDTLSQAMSGFPRAALDQTVSNYEILTKLGVFSDPANLIRMERGEAPYAKALGWEEEKIVLGHRISPFFAPEAASHLLNLVVMPESIRDLQVHEIRNFGLDHLKKWVGDKVLDSSSANEIYDILTKEGS